MIIEQAMSKSSAIEECYSLGLKFVEHFDKAVREGTDSRDFYYHCKEMQGWWNKVRGIKLKNTNRLIGKVNLMDWFFTLGMDIEDFIDDKYAGIYENMILRLLNNYDCTVYESLSGIMDRRDQYEVL